MLWAAAWLYQATGDGAYLDFLGSAQNNGGGRSMFSWDDKFVGVQILVSKVCGPIYPLYHISPINL